MPKQLDLAQLLANARANKALRDVQEVIPDPVPPPNNIRKDTGIDLSSLAGKFKIAGTTTDRFPAKEEVAAATLVAGFTDNVAGSTPVPKNELKEAIAAVYGMSGELIEYNEQQQRAVDLGGSGESFVLVGAAGTGKTTCSQGVIKALLASGKIPTLQTEGHRHLSDGTPGIIIVSFTRRAVNNIRKVQSEEMKFNCITIHKLLEYAPEYFDIEDPETGETKTTMRFEPMRNEYNPLPSSIHTIVVEEASMEGTDLHEKLVAALPHKVQWIFIGDIQQLPPVFGPAMLGFKMLSLPVVELTKVYRQALQSPIIRLAHRILSGKPIPFSEYDDWTEDGEHGSLKLRVFKKKLDHLNAALTLGVFFTRAIDSGDYDPDSDMILIPYNKACGTIELNNKIANHLARKRDAVTHEIMAGYIKHYYSAGDRVLYDREDAEIIEISPNPSYTGARVQHASKHLDYWGRNHNLANEQAGVDYGTGDTDMDVEELLASVVASEDRVTQSSHKLIIRLLDTGSEIELTKAAEVNSLLHAYALTVHKSQGSEWGKVFLCFHQSHATMLQRELLYTAVTRAKQDLYIVCEKETFTKGIVSQRIKGNTLKEKAEFFKGKQLTKMVGTGKE